MRVRLDRHGVVVGYAAFAALCRPLTVQAAVAVAMPGIVLVVLAARRQPPPRVVLARRYVAPMQR